LLRSEGLARLLDFEQPCRSKKIAKYSKPDIVGIDKRVVMPQNK